VGGYYYLIAQLPYLSYGQKPPMSSAAYKELAKSMLDKGDAKLLDTIELDPVPFKPGDEGPTYSNQIAKSGSAFLDGWRNWERTFRLNLAKARAVKLNREGAPKSASDVPSSPPEAVALGAKMINASESPLDVELLIDKARWIAIEELAGSNYFSTNTVFAYLLKLLLLERRELFKAEEGYAEYNSLYDAILDGVQSDVSPVGESK